MQDFDLRDLEAFIAVARARSFRRAAAEQRVSVSSLSQRLRDMEERLGVRLMNRTTRSVALTQAGELLLDRIGPAMRDVGQALGRNPCPIVVPCHRVLAAGQKPGGFSANGGVVTKLQMLAIEGAVVNHTPSLFD